MSDLTNVEKRRLELLLNMGGGYVLNFSDRTFNDFFLDNINFDINSRYNGSKANRLRTFWRQDTNSIVGKLMSDMLDYGEDCKLFSGKDELLETCRGIVARLRQNSPAVTFQTSPRPSAQHSSELATLRDTFLQLANEADRNKAGLALEKLLNRLFALFGLKPRQPFRVVGEQIDGSFVLDGDIYLLESKWENHALSEGPLLVFRGKIEGKSTFTRGVFIALNDVTQEARDAITRGKAPSFFIMNGHDLLMVLSGAVALPDFLRERCRLLAEEGRVCVPFSELPQPHSDATGG
jgi:hypothetical protein